jgi:hypothetical protein
VREEVRKYEEVPTMAALVATGTMLSAATVVAW